jgi:hypothetical protein
MIAPLQSNETKALSVLYSLTRLLLPLIFLNNYYKSRNHFNKYNLDILLSLSYISKNEFNV